MINSEAFIPKPKQDKPLPVALGRVSKIVPFDGRSLVALAKPYSGKSLGHLYSGPSWVNADGTPCIVVVTPNDLWPKKVRQAGECALLAWRWNDVPSAPFSLTLMVKSGSPRPHMRWMKDSSDSVVQAMRKEGRLLLNVISTAGQSSGWLECVFQDNFEPDALPSKTELEGLWTFPVPGIPYSNVKERFDPLRSNPYNDDRLDEIPLWAEPVSDLWNTLACNGPWAEDLSPIDIAIGAWAKSAYSHRSKAAAFIQTIAEKYRIDKVVPLLDDQGKLHNNAHLASALDSIVKVCPILGKLLVAIAGPNPDAQIAHNLMVEILFDPTASATLFVDLVEIVRQVDNDELPFAVGCCIEAALRDHRLTRTGSARPWFTSSERGRMQIQFLDIDLSAPLDNIKALWRSGLSITDLIDIGYRIGPSDFPVALGETCKALAEVKIEGSLEDAEARVYALLAEARDARQWSIPWGARVELQFGPFVAMRIFESQGEFACHFLDSENRYMHVAIGIQHNPPQIAMPDLYRNIDEPGGPIENLAAETALKLIAAAIVRDFVVVEDRTAVFKTRLFSGRKQGGHPAAINYLPRVRYSQIHPGGMPLDQESIARSRHAVAAHLRRVNNASAAQRFLAQKYGVSLPPGFTFVRPHERGGGAQEDLIRVYRSRSASRMIFQAIDNAVDRTQPAWFVFEKDCAQLLACMGMQVIHQAANRDGDGGVDLYAVDAEGQSWVVQCKCWSLKRPVGPGTVRELEGAIRLADHGSETRSKGKVITTSTFTKGAVEAAELLGFELIDGNRLATLLTSN